MSCRRVVSRLPVRPAGALAAVLSVVLSVSSGGCGESATASPGEGVTRPLPTDRVLGQTGRSAGEFLLPRAVDVGGGLIWIADKAGRMQGLDEDGRPRVAWTMREIVKGKPVGLTVFGDRLYVADTHYHRVTVYELPRLDRDGTVAAGEPRELMRFGSYGTGPGEFVYVTDIAVLPGPDSGPERLYVGEYGGNDRISVFDREGRFLFAFGRPGEPEDEADGVPRFDRPQALELDAARGRLIVADANHHRVGVFALDGSLQRWIGTGRPGVGAGELSYPYGLALLGDGTVLVTELNGHRLTRIDPGAGRILESLGGPGREEGRLTNPWGVAVAHDAGWRSGRVYVLDSGNDRVQSFPLPRGWRGEGDLEGSR